MLNIYGTRQPEPTHADHFIDKVHLWLREPLSASELRHLRKQCDGHVHFENRLPWFNLSYAQHLQLHQPRAGAFATLAFAGDAHVNHIELALDGIFEGGEGDRQARRAARFIQYYLIQPRSRAEIRFAGPGDSSFYFGRRWRNAAFPAGYADRPSKKTGEFGCCHIELRFYGRKTLERRGISSVTDLLQLDQRALWAKEFLLVNPEWLGLLYDNHVRGRRLRGPTISRGRNYAFHDHSAVGSRLIRESGSMQQLLKDRRLPKQVQSRIRECCWPHISMIDAAFPEVSTPQVSSHA